MGRRVTPEVSADLAARALAAIDLYWGEDPATLDVRTADRERVASDLAGLRTHTDCLHDDGDRTCHDKRRYADGLRRTAALYGLTP